MLTILKLIPYEKHGEIGQTLLFDHIIPTWQYELIKQQPGLVVSEHSLDEAGSEISEASPIL